VHFTHLKSQCTSHIREGQRRHNVWFTTCNSIHADRHAHAAGTCALTPSLACVPGAAEAIVQWVFGSEGVLSLGDESSSTMSWEILYSAINKTIAREQVRHFYRCLFLFSACLH
jgi:hypothetical protein